MVLRVEKQREVHTDLSNEFNSIMVVKGQFQKEKSQGKKKEFGKRENRSYDYCNGNSHTWETCFKLNGYPEWFTKLIQKKGNGKGNMAANAYEKVAEIKGKAEQKIEKASVDWSSMIQQEIAKYMQN